MPLTGQSARDHEKRRAETLAKTAETSRTPGQVGIGMRNMFTQPSVPGFFQENSMSRMLKAKCKRLAGRATVVGNTAFHFDGDGICRVVNEGNRVLDFEALLRQNGVVQLLDDETPAPSDHVAFQSAAPKAPKMPMAAATFELPPPPIVEAPTDAELPKTAAELPVGEPAELQDDMEAAPPDLVVPSQTGDASADTVVETRTAPQKIESRRKPASNK